MKLRTILAVAVTSAVVGPLTSVAILRADGPRTLAPASKNDALRLAAPGALEPMKRAIKLGAAIKAIGVAQSPPQTLETRVTPVAPRAAGGAQIVRAGIGTFNGADADEPDGSYMLARGTGFGALSTIEMRIPTEAGKLYVLDCRVRTPPSAGTKLMLVRAGSSSPVTVEDGHVLDAFVAKGAQTDLTLAASTGPNEIQGPIAYFYGCDFGRAN